MLLVRVKSGISGRLVQHRLPFASLAERRSLTAAHLLITGSSDQLDPLSPGVGSWRRRSGTAKKHVSFQKGRRRHNCEETAAT